MRVRSAAQCQLPFAGPFAFVQASYISHPLEKMCKAKGLRYITLCCTRQNQLEPIERLVKAFQFHLRGAPWQSGVMSLLLDMRKQCQ